MTDDMDNLQIQASGRVRVRIMHGGRTLGGYCADVESARARVTLLGVRALASERDHVAHEGHAEGMHRLG